MDPSPLEPLMAATRAKAAAEANAKEVDQAWRQEIKTAAAHGFKMSAIAEAAGISVDRVYQIRNDRR